MHQNEKHWNKTKGNRKKEMKEIHILFSFTCLRFFSATVNVFFFGDCMQLKLQSKTLEISSGNSELSKT